jgi:hypothetical protein
MVVAANRAVRTERVAKRILDNLIEVVKMCEWGLYQDCCSVPVFAEV